MPFRDPPVGAGSGAAATNFSELAKQYNESAPQFAREELRGEGLDYQLMLLDAPTLAPEVGARLFESPVGVDTAALDRAASLARFGRYPEYVKTDVWDRATRYAVASHSAYPMGMERSAYLTEHGWHTETLAGPRRIGTGGTSPARTVPMSMGGDSFVLFYDCSAESKGGTSGDWVQFGLFDGSGYSPLRTNGRNYANDHAYEETTASGTWRVDANEYEGPVRIEFFQDNGGRSHDFRNVEFNVRSYVWGAHAPFSGTLTTLTQTASSSESVGNIDADRLIYTQEVAAPETIRLVEASGSTTGHTKDGSGGAPWIGVRVRNSAGVVVADFGEVTRHTSTDTTTESFTTDDARTYAGGTTDGTATVELYGVSGGGAGQDRLDGYDLSVTFNPDGESQ